MNEKQQMNDDLLRDCIKEIIDMATSTKNEARTDFIEGKMLAYNEVLSTLKTYLTPLEPKEFGLDFDVDEVFA